MEVKNNNLSQYSAIQTKEHKRYSTLRFLLFNGFCLVFQDLWAKKRRQVGRLNELILMYQKWLTIISLCRFTDYDQHRFSTRLREKWKRRFCLGDVSFSSASKLNILEELNHSRIVKIHQQSWVAVTVSMYFQATGTKGDNKEGWFCENDIGYFNRGTRFSQLSSPQNTTHSNITHQWWAWWILYWHSAWAAGFILLCHL